MKKFVKSVIALVCAIGINLNAQVVIGGSSGGGVTTSADHQLVVETVNTLAPFRSVPAYKSWAVRQVAQIQLDFESESMVDSMGYGWAWGYKSESPSIEEMADIVASADIKFRLAKQAQVKTKVAYTDSGWNSLFEGETYFWPWLDMKTAGFFIPPGLKLVVGIPEFVRIKLQGVSRLQVILDEYGSPSSQENIFPDGQGYFNIPRRMIGNTGTLVATPFGADSDNSKFAFRINDGQVVQLKYLSGNVRPTMDGVESLLNPAKIDIKPESMNGVGRDLLKEVTYTTNTLEVVVTPVTSEGEIADTIAVVNLSTGNTAMYAINPKGLDVSPRSIKLPFKAGRYHVYANWFHFQDESAEYGCPPGYDCSGGLGKGVVKNPIE